MKWAAASALLVFYVWLFGFLVAVPVFFVVSVTPSYWTSFSSFASVVAMIALILAVLTSVSSICWAILLITFRVFNVRLAWWQHALASIAVALLGCGVYVLIYLALSFGGDAEGNGYLALGLLGPMACTLIFPLLATAFTRYHGQLRLDALFAHERWYDHAG